MQTATFLEGLEACVAQALKEDLGHGDITAELIPPDHQANARVICREQAVICGRPWVDAVFAQLDPSLEVHWAVEEGHECHADELIFSINGPARTLLSGERVALNFLQTLSGTATQARHYQRLVAGTNLTVLDTRKTIPGLRLAQKYAVQIGGCENHRLGLYDAFLIKENHITAKGGIPQVIKAARALHPDKPIEIEVENLNEFDLALEAGADIIMLDNFSNDMLCEAVSRSAGKAKLEASGGYDEQDLADLAATGVDYVSIGGLTKHCQAIDFSMRME